MTTITSLAVSAHVYKNEKQYKYKLHIISCIFSVLVIALICGILIVPSCCFCAAEMCGKITDKTRYW